MSRSFKKTPIVGIAGHSEKQDKRLGNRKFRKMAKHAIKQGKLNKLPYDMDSVQDVWSMSKDGKIYLHKDSEYFKSNVWKRK